LGVGEKMQENNGFEEIDYLPMKYPFGNSYNPYKWGTVLDYIDDYIKKLGKELTLRYLYYRIIEVPKLNIPLVKDTYNAFESTLMRARKDYTNPRYDILRKYIIEDTRKRDIEKFYDWIIPSESALKLAIDSYLTKERYVYPYDKYVELWFEDAGMYQMYKDIASNYRISTECIGGNLVINSVYRAFSRFKDKNGIILYIGDFNPSGNRRAYNIKTALADVGIDIDIKKILVTNHQIKEYNIKPDINNPKIQERIEKAKRDPNVKWHIEKYGTDVYDVNAEAMEYNDVVNLITKAISQEVDISKLDDLEESETLDYTFEWDDKDSCYRIFLDERLGGN